MPSNRQKHACTGPKAQRTLRLQQSANLEARTLAQHVEDGVGHALDVVDRQRVNRKDVIERIVVHELHGAWEFCSQYITASLAPERIASLDDLWLGTRPAQHLHHANDAEVAHAIVELL